MSIGSGMDIPIDFDEEFQEPPVIETSGCATRCYQRCLILLTFSITLFLGLSLAMAGLFRERIGNDELDANRVQYKSKNVGMAGLSIVVYAFIGLCISCSVNLYERVSES